MSDRGGPARYAEVVFPMPARMGFTYRIPQEWDETPAPGCRVLAPLGKRKALGYVSSLSDRPPEGVQTIKSLIRAIDSDPLFGAEMLRFLRWVSDYYLCSLGETFAAAYPFAPSVKPRMVKVVALDGGVEESGAIPETVTRENQRKVLEFLINRKALLSPADVQREVGVSSATLKTLEKNGLLRIAKYESLRGVNFAFAGGAAPAPALTDEQQRASETIRAALDEQNPLPLLIKGVTGSGKTEVYLNAIEMALKQGKNALALIPEISLTPQTMDRFRSRFGELAGILHSGLGRGERYDEWRQARRGQRKIIVGTRSAVFAPLDPPGLIIVDEEHDGSYKQSDPSPRYQGRDLAVARARLCGALCVLGSATPSVESTHNASTGKYRSVRLDKRIGRHGLPKVNLIDMRGRTGEEEIFSAELKDALWTQWRAGRQAILFLNRRGFSTSLSCKNCGTILNCQHCSVALVYHQNRGLLMCHHCEYQTKKPDYCPSCGESFIRQRGFGTEKVAEEAQKLLPEARVLRLDRDVTQRKGEHDRLLARFKQGGADIMVGTQMIAKGLDFPNVTLVGIVNADYALALPDFRAAERTFTLLTQVAGRAGRGTEAGEVFVQSHCPNHYGIQLALDQDYDRFFAREIRYRRLIGFPPFSRLVLWRVEGVNESEARGRAWDLYTLLSKGLQDRPGVTLLPPVEAPLYRLRDHFRWQVALKSRDHKAFRPLINSGPLQKFLSLRRNGLRIVQDVDPSDML